MIRTRFAPSPTGYMHIGNLRTALYEYLIAKSGGGAFILRIEDTDRERIVEGAVELIYKTLKLAGIKHDEGPDIGGDYGPYIQSERTDYMRFAKQLTDKGDAYYCFCDKERLAGARGDISDNKYDRHCLQMSDSETKRKLEEGVPFVIRQKIPEGRTTFHDEVYGDITVENEEMEDQVLIKSDGFPTYNFANVIDDHLMKITHVVRGSEYLSSTPKYNLLYDALGFELPTYIHLPPVMKNQTEKLSKRSGDPSFEDLIEMGFLPDAIVNYVALLGFCPSENQEIFTMEELIRCFDIKGLSKSPAIFDIVKLTWMNGEYIKKMDFNDFYDMTHTMFKDAIKREDIDIKKIAGYVQTRLPVLNDIPKFVDFIDDLPEYDCSLYVHKKMKTTEELALSCLEKLLPCLLQITDWTEDTLHQSVMELIAELGVKNGQMLWPLRTALSGKETSPCGATELAALLGKQDTIERLKKGIEMLRPL